MRQSGPMRRREEASSMRRQSGITSFVLLGSAWLFRFSIALGLAMNTWSIACRAGDSRDAGTSQIKPTEPTIVSFPTSDGGLIYADAYGTGDKGVVLVHGGRFNKASWAKQAQALAKAGFRVLAIDLRGYGKSRGPGGSSRRGEGSHLDILSAVRYLRQAGAKTVSVVGASFGGWAAAGAAAEAEPGEIDRLILLAASSIEHPERMKCRKLFIVSRNDTIGNGRPRLPIIRKLYDRAPEPKELVILEGSAHAQYIFETDQGERLMREMIDFLSEP